VSFFSVAAPGRLWRLTSCGWDCFGICGRSARTSDLRRLVRPVFMPGQGLVEGLLGKGELLKGPALGAGGRPWAAALVGEVDQDGDALALADADDPVSAGSGEVVSPARQCGCEPQQSPPGSVTTCIGFDFGARTPGRRAHPGRLFRPCRLRPGLRSASYLKASVPDMAAPLCRAGVTTCSPLSRRSAYPARRLLWHGPNSAAQQWSVAGPGWGRD
jgi:hypothetical protein